MDWLVLGIVIVLVAFAIYYPQIPQSLSLYRRFRRPQRLTCPARGAKTLVQVDAARAAGTMLFWGFPQYRVKSCARWSGEKDCKRDCLAQVI